MGLKSKKYQQRRVLDTLEILDVSNCWKFQKLPDSFANMRRLKRLYMRGTRIKELQAVLDIWNLLASHIALTLIIFLRW